LFLINTHNGIASKNIPPIDIEEYPVIKEHLDKYWVEIKNRDDQGITPYNLRSCAYMDDFSKQKIIYPDIMRMPRNFDVLHTYPYFYFDKDEFYIEATCFMLTGLNLELIFSFLVSDIGFYTFSKFYSGPQFDETGFRYKKEYINNLYIPNVVKSDDIILTQCFNATNINNKKIDKLSEEIFVKSIGLDEEEFGVIKKYKNLLLSSKT
jgi:hypothetical protein